MGVLLSACAERSTPSLEPPAPLTGPCTGHWQTSRDGATHGWGLDEVDTELRTVLSETWGEREGAEVQHRSTTSYAPDGQVVETTWDELADGDVEITTRWTYDAQGRLIENIQLVEGPYDLAGTGVHYHDVHAWSPDGQHETASRDLHGDGEPDALWEQWYDADRLIRRENRHPDGTLLTRVDRTYAAPPSLDHVEVESNAEGEVLTTFERTYDPEGRLLTEIQESPLSRAETSHTWSAEGWLLSTHVWVQDLLQGSESSSVTQHTRDERGLIEESKTLQDQDNDGIPESSSAKRWRWDCG